MIRISIFSKFCNEYSFLEARLKQQKFLSEKNDIVITQNILIEDKLWSGKKNLLNLDKLSSLKNQFSGYFDYRIVNIKTNFAKTKSRRCREDHANCLLAEYSRNFQKLKLSCLIISDIDEVLDLKLVNEIKEILLSGQKFVYPFFVKQYSCWFTLKYFYKNNWPGPIIFFNEPLIEEISLAQTSRHDSGIRTYQINGGYHLSYFKSSILSKKNNSHGLKFFKIKLLFALIGIDPFLRNDKAFKFKNVDDSFIFYKELSYRWIDLRKLLFKFGENLEKII